MSDYAVDQRRRTPTRVRRLGEAVPVYRLTPIQTPDGGGEKTVTQIDKTIAELFAERRDQAELTTRCAVDGCGWTHTATAAEGRAAAASHRAEVHPELVGRRTYRKTSKAYGKASEEEIVEARRRRAEREDAERLEKVERGRQRMLEEAAPLGDVGAVSSSSPLDYLAETEPEPQAAVAAVESSVAAPALKRTASTPPAPTGRAPSGEASASATTEIAKELLGA